jgi:hypothetical protein
MAELRGCRCVVSAVSRSHARSGSRRKVGKERLHYLVRVVVAEVCRKGGLQVLLNDPGSKRETFQATVCVLAFRPALLGSYFVGRDISRPHVSWEPFRVYILCRILVMGESCPPYLKAAFSQASATLTLRVTLALVCLLPND